MPVTTPMRGTADSRIHKRLAAAAGNPLFWVVFLAVAFGWPIWRTLRTPLPPALPILATIPDFSLVDQEGRRFGSEELRGKVWAANFVFTRCTGPCPDLTAKMAAIQHRARGLGDAFHLATFSVDPAYDTPERLAQYARSHHASPRMWSFLTGSFDDVKKTVVEGMKIGIQNEGSEDDFMNITHGTHFILVDRQLRIRGYYDSSGEHMEDTILRDAGLLVNRGE
jgi:protein SCO1/2